MSSTLEDRFKAGSVIAITLFSTLVYLLVINASSLTAAIDTVEKSMLVLFYSVFPSSGLALIVDLIVSVVGGALAADGFEFDIRVFVVVAGFLWIGTNLVMNWVFPPI